MLQIRHGEINCTGMSAGWMITDDRSSVDVDNRISRPLIMQASQLCFL